MRIFNYLQLITLTLLISIFTNAQEQKAKLDSTNIYISEYQWAIVKTQEYPKKSYALLQKCGPFFKEQTDTAKYINCLLFLSDIDFRNGAYAKAFDYLWKALYYAKEYKNIEYLSTTHRKLSILYDLYGMDSISMQHIEKALSLSRMHSNNSFNQLIHLNVGYLNLAIKKRKLGAYKEALITLDSCDINQEISEHLPWFVPSLELERGKLFTILENFNKAEASILVAHKNIPLNDSTLVVVLNKRKAELWEAKGQMDSAITFYKKALQNINYSIAAKAYEADINDKLSRIHSIQGNYMAAYESLNRSKSISDYLMAERTKANSEIFAINNSYHKSLGEKGEQIEKHKNMLKRKSDIQFRLQIIITLLLLLISALALIWQMRKKLQKTIIAKQASELASKMELEKNKTQLQVKTKELTAYTLRLVEKESSVNELLQTIKELSVKDYKRHIATHKSNERSIWEEFNKRFIEVNDSFYDKLSVQFPNLSLTEQKHCALIKLNLSTKNMAQILRVESHTINMSRSRIRKKMGLKREDNLIKFIAQI